jgi:hypothetical protein
MLMSERMMPSSLPAATPTGMRLDRADWQLLGLWLMLRLLTCAWVALVAPLRPLTERERAIAPWPPSAPLGAWLERALLAPWERRDAVYYVNIVGRGYRLDDGTVSFHPLLAWLATPLAWLSSSPLLALLLVVSVASALLLLVFERLARLDLGAQDARTSTLLLAFSPLAFILFAPYTESLCLLFGVLCLLWARRRSWWLAGLAGGLAALTRQQGVFLALPLAWELWEAADRRWRNALGAWRNWLALGMVPAGLLVWLIYRAVALNDLRADFSNPQALIFSWLISSSTTQVVPVQQFLWPWQALWLALTKFWSMPEYSLLIDLVLGAAFVVLLALAWRHMRISYRIYAVTIVLVSFSYHTGMLYPYIALPRHLLLAFPVFIGLGPRFRGPLLRFTILVLGLLAMLFLLLQYVIEGWVP